MLYPIKDLYHKRLKGLKGELPKYYSYNLDEKMRFRIIAIIFDYNYIKAPDEMSRLLEGAVSYNELSELISIIEREIGNTLFKGSSQSTKTVQNFLSNCEVELFLSSIEVLLSLKVNNMHKERYSGKEFNNYHTMKRNLQLFIETLNEIFSTEKIGYEIVPVNLPKLPYMIVPFNSKYLYLETIKRPMSLMYAEDFKGALNEFEDALDEYRNEIYKDSIHKANKSYESTLKTILDLKDIEYSSKDNIPKLVEKIRNNTDIIDSNIKSAFDSVWSVLHNGPPTIRNQPGVGHGQGKEIKDIEKSYADFVLRLTGTYIVFLIERYKETI